MTQIRLKLKEIANETSKAIGGDPKAIIEVINEARAVVNIAFEKLDVSDELKELLDIVEDDFETFELQFHELYCSIVGETDAR